jgi:hypothetical protein
MHETPGAAEPTDDLIARRAFEIAERGDGDCPETNWFRAAEELWAERTAVDAHSPLGAEADE